MSQRNNEPPAVEYARNALIKHMNTLTVLMKENRPPTNTEFNIFITDFLHDMKVVYQIGSNDEVDDTHNFIPSIEGITAIADEFLLTNTK